MMRRRTARWAMLAMALGVASGGHATPPGAVLAAQTQALSAAEMMRSPELIAAAKPELVRRRGADFADRPIVGDRKPALDYRVNGQHTAD